MSKDYYQDIADAVGITREQAKKMHMFRPYMSAPKEVTTSAREKLLVDQLHAICSTVNGLVGWRSVAFQIQRDVNQVLAKLDLPTWKEK